MQSRGSRVEPFGGVLVTGALENDSAQEQWILPCRLEERLETVRRDEELWMEELVRTHLVERVATALLGRAEGLLGLVQVAGAEERDAVVELHDRIRWRALRDGLERVG